MTMAQRSVAAVLVTGLWSALASATLLAAPLNHGNFFGATVDYLNVTETSNFPLNVEPKFGAPTITGDSLDFDPQGFSVTSIGGVPAFMDVQLNFTIMSHINRAITNIRVDELGDFSLLGIGTANTAISYALSLASIKVFEIDHVPLASPLTLPSLSVSGSENLISSPGSGQSWSLSADYDVAQSLLNSGIPFNFGATKIEIALDNTLAALSESQSIAFVAKKDVGGVSISVETIPEPSSLMMLAGFCLAGSAFRRQRR